MDAQPVKRAQRVLVPEGEGKTPRESVLGLGLCLTLLAGQSGDGFFFLGGERPPSSACCPSYSSSTAFL